jgi:flavin reductase (DIM6/NTAB) family NADH-FMN oxidoreductase RutF
MFHYRTTEIAMDFRFSEIDPKIRYKLLSATVTPRPIAWVSTLDEAGRSNAAPFSFFNVFGGDPATVGFSILHRSPDDPKDTGRNIARSGEFVVNLVSDDNLGQMNVSAIEFGSDVDEFTVAGLTPVPSVLVKPPRIGESKVAFECRLMQTVKLGEMRSLILGEVLLMHIMDDFVVDRERGWVDTPGLRLVGRTSAGSYVRTNEVIELTTLSPESGSAATPPDERCFRRRPIAAERAIGGRRWVVCAA